MITVILFFYKMLQSEPGSDSIILYFRKLNICSDLTGYIFLKNIPLSFYLNEKLNSSFGPNARVNSI